MVLMASKSSFLRFEGTSVLYLAGPSFPGESLVVWPPLPAPGGGDADFFCGAPPSFWLSNTVALAFPRALRSVAPVRFSYNRSSIRGASSLGLMGRGEVLPPPLLLVLASVEACDAVAIIIISY